MKKTPAHLKAHPDYQGFSRLMHGGVYYNLREHREILRSEAFKRFAALFPKSDPAGDHSPDMESSAAPEMSSVVNPTSSPTRPS